ncbi:MAG: hypothetical protein HUU54_08810 [Ignavibacteriaceae bacterium]|nr:hypothetical protein [Ignavibacteriaceae bacterium]
MTLVEILIFTSGFLLFAILLSVFYGINAERKSKQKLEELHHKGIKVVNDLKQQTAEKTSATTDPARSHTIEEIKRHIASEPPAPQPQPQPQRTQHRLEKFEPEQDHKEQAKKPRRNYRDLWK